jgi:kynurenine formamidase
MTAVSPAFQNLVDLVDNTGRWGDDDQRGTLNLITDEVLRRAASTVQQGQIVSLSVPLQLRGIQDGVAIPARINPLRTMIAINEQSLPEPAPAFNDDIVVTPTQAATHWDALSHVSWLGRMYNGVPADAVDYRGASRLGIETYGPVASRAVLLDVARHLDQPVLDKSTVITAQLLREVEEAQDSPIESGDIVLVRTGGVRRFYDGDLASYRAKASGLSADTALFFHERGVAAAAADTSMFEYMPAAEAEIFLPLHVLALVQMGMPLGENWDLERLGDACNADRRYTGLLEASPEQFVQSTGGLVHPTVIR